MEWLISRKKSFSRGTTSNSYLSVTEPTMDQVPFGSLEYTHNSELHVPPPKRHVRARGIPIGLNGMTVSHSESVKS
jgi:hypothetical protein